jgi:hypothetical protein
MMVYDEGLQEEGNGSYIRNLLMQSRPRTIDEIFPLMQDKKNYDGVCVHKDLFSPFAVMDVVGTFVLIVIMALATMGGIGGGGVVVLLIQ